MTRPPNPAPSRPPWQCSHAAVAGLKHRRAGRPTQDACLASATGPYPFLIVCDGRGSATRSDLGAQASVEAIAAVIGSATDLLAACLDSTDDGQAETVFALLARLLCRTAAAAQERLARHHRQEARAFEHTLLVACLGRHRLGW
ncbi:MAG: protein phosphatase 2C domain-containing protein, partial [Lentisphaerae bacterium]|nr:protein phosphatase 2C domain-containing protein [Lentisphaerota bacterium]